VFSALLETTSTPFSSFLLFFWFSDWAHVMPVAAVGSKKNLFAKLAVALKHPNLAVKLTFPPCGSR